MRHVLIVGAGDTGLRLASRLVARGDRVATLNRSGRSVPGATVVRADLGEPETLRDLPHADIVVSTTAPPRRDDAGYRLAYVDGPAAVLAALPTPPTRLVMTSTTGVYGVDDGSWVDATTPPVPARRTAEIVLDGETRTAALVPFTAVRAAGIYGPGRERLIESVRTGDAGVTADTPPRWTNRIHVDDLAAALEAVVDAPAPPAAVIAVDDEPCPRAHVLRFLADRLGVGLGPDPDPTDRPRGKRCRNDALRELGWAPAYPSYREGYAAILDGG